MRFGLASSTCATASPRRAEKTGTPVTLPLLPPLIEALRAGPIGELAYICGANGKPMTKESFGNAFADACRAAGEAREAIGKLVVANESATSIPAPDHKVRAAGRES